ncbi:hypothetical protein [Tahibacter caeni]|uniref:hypothetical protein n=1 Tax=Tahibacter caeni TaxID=1453545 RepID=UPI002149689B|nr:hypothetical protein [Tahibacter caeni]
MIRYFGIAAALLAAGLSGCAVGPIAHDNKPMRDKDGFFVAAAQTGSDGAANAPARGGRCTDDFEPSYCNALELADGYRRGYMRRAGRISTLRETSGLLAIPAAAAALYYGLSGREVFNDRILRLSVGAAGVYAAGNWSLKATREQVYLSGARAMTCAAIQSLQFVVPKAIANKNIGDVLADLRARIDTLQATLERGRLSDTVREQAIGAVNDASDVYANLSYLHGETKRAGIILSARVLMIDAQVREAVSRNSPTLDSLRELLGGLQGYAKTFGSDRVIAAPAQVEQGTASSADSAELAAQAIREDAKAREDMSALSRSVGEARVYLRHADSAKTSFEAVAACAPEGGRTFQILPDSGSVEITATQSYSITINDRVGHPVVALGGTPNAAVKLQPVQIGKSDDQYVAVVTTEATTQAISGPVLSIRSANGLEGRDIAIRVVPAQQAAPANPTPAPAGTAKRGAGEPRYPAERDFLDSTTDLFAVQCLVGADPDCRIGPETRAAIRNFRARQGLTGDDEINQPLVDAAKAAPHFNDLFTCAALAEKPEERRQACRKPGAPQ